MIGFSSANRVDMDEFSQGAALVGAQKTLTTVSDSVSPKRLTYGSVASSSEGPSGQRLLGSSDKGSLNRNSTAVGEISSGMDTTLHATMDMGGGARESEDD
jgi:hypothetical protein